MILQHITSNIINHLTPLLQFISGSNKTNSILIIISDITTTCISIICHIKGTNNTNTVQVYIFILK